MIKLIFKLLFFNLKKEDFLQFNRKHFFVGLIGTWMVGIGRYWDDPGAHLVQHLGLGSVIYIFVLGAIIWLLILPFKIEKWSYFTVVVFISLTSFPAILYAIPVEKFWSIQTSNTINVWFLAIVAAWRLCLLFYFFKQFTELNVLNVLTVTLLPICTIITTLTFLNLHRVVFDVMGGLRESSSHDSSYSVLVVLTVISAILLIPLLISYAIGIYKRRKALHKNTL